MTIDVFQHFPPSAFSLSVMLSSICRFRCSSGYGKPSLDVYTRPDRLLHAHPRQQVQLSLMQNLCQSPTHETLVDLHDSVLLQFLLSLLIDLCSFDDRHMIPATCPRSDIWVFPCLYGDISGDPLCRLSLHYNARIQDRTHQKIQPFLHIETRQSLNVGELRCFRKLRWHCYTVMPQAHFSRNCGPASDARCSNGKRNTRVPVRSVTICAGFLR